jgi:hypothetical protein
MKIASDSSKSGLIRLIVWLCSNGEMFNNTETVKGRQGECMALGWTSFSEASQAVVDTDISDMK